MTDPFQLFSGPMDPEDGAVGELPSDRGEPNYTFATVEALVAHFSRWLDPKLILSLVEMEKTVFVVRRECSLEETRLQFLKKCEASLLLTLSRPESGAATTEWYPAA